MIPIDDNDLLEIHIQDETDVFYRNLLQNQYNALITIEDTIRRKAVGIYNLYVTTVPLSPNDTRIKARCCNFPLLEQKMKEYVADRSTT